MNQQVGLRRVIGITLALLPFAAAAQLGSFSSTYTFANTTTSSGTVDPTPTPTADGVNFGSFSAHGLGANSTAAGRFAYSGWNTTGGIDANRYYQVTLAPAVGYTLNLDSISFGVRRSSTGPRDFTVRSSVDGFAADVPTASATSPEIATTANAFRFVNDIAPAANITGNTVQLPSAYDTLTQPVTFRFYAANPESAAGSFTVDDVTITGAAAVPEPHEYAAVSAAALVVFAAAKRRLNRSKRGE